MEKIKRLLQPKIEAKLDKGFMGLVRLAKRLW
jgi:hypothetical protein